MRARRIVTIIGVMAGIALCFGLGFGSGIIVQHSHSRKKGPKPIDPPPELSEVGRRIWELSAKVTYAEDYIWLEHDERARRLAQVGTAVKHIFESALPYMQLEEFFTNAPEGMEDNPEYWYERWNFWRSVYEFNAEKDDKAIRATREHQVRLAHDKMLQYKDSYSPVTMRLALRSWNESF